MKLKRLIDKEIMDENAKEETKHLGKEIVRLDYILKTKGEATTVFSLVGAKKSPQEQAII